MKIGAYVSLVAGMKGFESNVSGHIQAPLYALKLLADAGHEVHLITNEFGDDRSLPHCLPKEVELHLVPDARQRGGFHTRTGEQKAGVSPLRFQRQMLQIKSIAHKVDLDVLHSWGQTRSVMLGGALSLMGLRTSTVATLMGANLAIPMPKVVMRSLWRRNRAVTTATRFVADLCQKSGLPCEIVKHGAVRNIRAEVQDEAIESPRRRVLFWRDPSWNNGCDVVKTVYEQLAAKYPDLTFDLAIRPHWKEVEGLDELARRHENINIYRFPYEDGITLPKLILESVCVLMPIRYMSVDPQFVIVESMEAGVPVIASDLRSTPEVITHGRSGMLVPVGDVDGFTEALEHMLADREKLAHMGQNAAQDIRENWNWNNYVEDISQIYDRAVRRGRA